MGVVALEETFTRFIETHRNEQEEIKYEQALSELALKGQKSIIIDFKDLYAFDEELSMELINNPHRTIDHFSLAVFSKLRMRDPEYSRQIKHINIRIRGLPTEVPLRKIGEEDIGRLIMVSGIVVRASILRPFILKSAFRCDSCAETIVEDQKEQYLRKPKACPSCQSRRGFTLIPKESTFRDSQRITIQERPEELPPGQLPRALDITLKDDIADKARPGDRISVTGTLDLLERHVKGGTAKIFDFSMDANNVDISGKEMELLEITPEDETKIKELAADPWIHQKIIQSIAPSLYGLEIEKEAILYLLFGGVTKELPGVRIRGDVNVLLVGDPGTGKSQLLLHAATTSPRGLLTTGRGSSAAGLTAAVIREGGTGGFVLEAGALVLADMGICCIDELDKMRDEDRGSIHPAMEQQTVSIAKGGIVATLNARAAILAAANPTLGRYNPYQTIAQNMNLPVTMLSRFDLIFLLRDLPEPEKDTRLAEHIIAIHKTAGKEIHPPIDQELLRKYISHAKRINPILTDEVTDCIRDFYVKMRAASTEGGEASAISITARQLESLIRIAEARARSHLRKEVTAADAEAAIAIMQRSLEQVGIDATTGKIDIDLLYTGKPRSLQMLLQKVLGVIAEMDRITGAVRDDDLFDALMSDHGIGRSEAARFIGTLMRDGTIYSPRPGYYKKTN